MRLSFEVGHCQNCGACIFASELHVIRNEEEDTVVQVCGACREEDYNDSGWDVVCVDEL